jgi:hypothetical protein
MHPNHPSNSRALVFSSPFRFGHLPLLSNLFTIDLTSPAQQQHRLLQHSPAAAAATNPRPSPPPPHTPAATATPSNCTCPRPPSLIRPPSTDSGALLPQAVPDPLLPRLLRLDSGGGVWSLTRYSRQDLSPPHPTCGSRLRRPFSWRVQQIRRPPHTPRRNPKRRPYMPPTPWI